MKSNGKNYIRDVLIDYMEENGFFTKHQHVFRKGRSCATQLIEESLLSSIDLLVYLCYWCCNALDSFLK
jgi:hypothetical protein